MKLYYQDVTILSGASLSEEVDVRHFQIVAIQMPTSWTTAALTFQARPGAADVTPKANETLQNVYDDAGTEVSVAAADDRYIALTGAKLDALTSVGALKIRSGTAGSPVNQDADRTLVLVLAPLG